MTGDDMTGDSLGNLIAAWLEGRLDAEGSHALQQELRDSSEARAKFREYTQLDAALHEFADTSDMLRVAQRIVSTAEHTSGDSRPSASVAAQETAPVDANRTQALVTVPPTRSGNNISGGDGTTTFSRLTSWYAVLAVAMLLLVSFLGYIISSRQQAEFPRQLASEEMPGSMERGEAAPISKPPAPVATLATAERALWESSQLKIGQALYEGESISLLEGEALISVGFGAEIIATAPCSLTFAANDQIKLHQGEVAVDVAPWAKGFTVVTEEMDIVDLGTTFTVSASPGMKSETTVLKGVVRVHPSKLKNDQRRGLLISEGQRVSIDGEGLLTNTLPEHSLRLLDSLDFGGTGPYRPVALNNTGIGLSVGDEDLHWRVVAGPEESFTGPQFAAVCVPHEAYLPNDPQKSQWISILNWQTAPANSTYTFQTEFNLEGYDLSTMQLFGRFLADNGVAEVRVNGKSVEVQSWVDNIKYQPFRDQQFRFVNVTEGLLEGRNVIEVDVRNGMQRAWDKKHKTAVLSPILNPMALRVEWYAFGRQYESAKEGNNARLLRQLQQQISPRLAFSYRVPEI